MARHANASTRLPQSSELMEFTSASMTSAYALWLEQAGTLTNETFRFAQERLAKDFDAATQILNCNDSAEALFLQLNFANNLAADYLAHSGRMLELMTLAASRRHH